MAIEEVTAETLEMLPKITVQKIVEHEVMVPVVGTTPLIVHQFSQKARQQILEDQAKKTKAKAARPPQDPEAEYWASRYIIDEAEDIDGFPASGFKAAIAGAARVLPGGVTMTSLKVGVFVVGEGSAQLVRIEGKRRKRDDAPRVGQAQTNLRFRAEYWPWRVRLNILYLPSLVDEESVVNLVHAAGKGGVGEWRPSSPKSLTGTFGRFQVDPEWERVTMAER